MTGVEAETLVRSIGALVEAKLQRALLKGAALRQHASDSEEAARIELVALLQTTVPTVETVANAIVRGLEEHERRTPHLGGAL